MNIPPRLHRPRNVVRVACVVLAAGVWHLAWPTGATTALAAAPTPGASELSIADSKTFGKPRSNGMIVDIDGNIYGTQEAYDLVVEAKKYDPNFAAEANRDRDKAAALYEKAIAAQPGAKGNAPLANRIAQMYATLSDPARGIVPQQEKAVYWWMKCLEYTDDTQLLWGQAQMGMACAGVVKHDPDSPADCLEKILKMDPQRLELPKWKDWAHTRPEEVATERVREADRLQDLLVTTARMIADLQARGNAAVARGRPPGPPAVAISTPPAPPTVEPTTPVESQPVAAPPTPAAFPPEPVVADRKGVVIGVAIASVGLLVSGIIWSRRGKRA